MLANEEEGKRQGSWRSEIEEDGEKFRAGGISRCSQRRILAKEEDGNKAR